MRVTLYNDFHNTEVRLNARRNLNGPHACRGSWDWTDGYQLTPSQVKRAQRVLCGMRDCVCGNDLGMRGPQNYTVDVVQDGRTGEVSAVVWPHAAK